MASACTRAKASAQAARAGTPGHHGHSVCGQRSVIASQAAASGPPRVLQYVERPPVMSNTAPVEKLHSALDSQAAIAAISCTSTKRAIGILLSM